MRNEIPGLHKNKDFFIFLFFSPFLLLKRSFTSDTKCIFIMLGKEMGLMFEFISFNKVKRKNNFFF